MPASTSSAPSRPGILAGSPRLSAPGHRYPPADGACARSASWLRHRREAPFFRGLRRLAVQAGGRRLRLASGLLPHQGAHRVAEPLPGPSALPGPEIVGDRLPGWVVMRQRAPGNPAAQHVALRIDDVARIVGTRAASGLGERQHGRKHASLGIGHVGVKGRAGHDHLQR